MNDQRWSLVPRGGGSFELHNRQTGMCLDVAGRNGARGDNVLLWNCDGGADQRWSWEPWTPRRVEVRPAVVDPPPPAPAMQPIGGEELRALRRAIDEQGFSENKRTVLEQAARTHLFRVAQVKELLGLFAFSEDKLHALKLLAPRMVDGPNSFALYDAFSFSGDQEKAREILRRNGY